MATQSIDIPSNTPIAAAGALTKAGYNVTTGGKPIQVSENDQPIEIDYDRVGELMKKYGWGDIMNTQRVDEFESSKYFKPNMTTEKYANNFNLWLDAVSKGEINEGKGSAHTAKWDRCVEGVKSKGKSEKSAYKICSSKIKDAGVKKPHQQKSGKEYIANRKETTEGQTMLDVFPELNKNEPQKGGEVKDIKLKQKQVTKAEKPKKEETPKKVKRDSKMETKTNKNNKQMEKVMTKREIMEMIQGAQPAPSTTPTPTTTPTIAPTKPAQRPDRQNPFKPKPGPNPNPKGSLPSWLSSDKLGIGKETPVSEDNMMEIKKIIKRLI